MTTKRQESIRWWRSLSDLQKRLWLPHLGGLVGRNQNSLTGSEIEKIYIAKCKEDSEFIEIAFSNYSDENKNKVSQRSTFGIGS